MKHCYKGTLEADYQESLEAKGGKEWLIGNFKKFEGSLRQTKLMELKYWKIENNPKHEPKTQTTAGEITIVQKGWIKGIVGDEYVTIKQGEYIYIPPGTRNNLIEQASNDAEGLTIKAPSDPSDCVRNG